MRALIKNGYVISPANNLKENLDILIENGIITEMKKTINDSSAYVIDAKDLYVVPGFVDLHPNFCDPGVTSREDLKSGSLAAIKGGYTHVILGTDNKPAPSECNVIEYIRKYAKIMPLNIYPSASVTNERLGYEMADIVFLHNHGAYAYYDGLKPIEDKELLKKIMETLKKINSMLSIYCEADDGKHAIKVHGILEGDVSKNLGLKGCTPFDSEYNDLEINIKLAKEVGCRLDLAYVTSEKSISLLEEAKKDCMDIVVETPIFNLALNEKIIEKQGAYAKLLPPLRPESERKSLCKALKKGIIDVISSNHVPIKEDDKGLKLKDASCGSISLETTLGLCGAKLVKEGVLSWKEVIEKISVNPAKTFGLDTGILESGKPANITIFDPNEKWKLNKENIVSKSHNSPIIGMELIGKVKYTICNGRLVYKDTNVNN